MLEIDASMGEGGGQIVRTCLSLSMCAGAPITLHNIRAHRRNPGLRAQHLAAVRAAAAICSAQVTGDSTASQVLSFRPGPIRPGRYEVDVGTAGSTMLVLQTILPPLSLCNRPSELLLRGGTHNPRAPTFEFVRDAWLGVLARLGFQVLLTLERHGFFPKGGGIVRASIKPFQPADALNLMERGPIRKCAVRVLISHLPDHIALREINVLRESLQLAPDLCLIEHVDAHGMGNALNVSIESAHVTTVFDGFGMRGVPAEKVASALAQEIQQYIDANVAVDRYLADQILLPLALGSGGQFSTMPPSTHTHTNVAVIQKFLPLDCEVHELAPGRWSLSLRRMPVGIPLSCRAQGVPAASNQPPQ
jgi:RNA 3'-terminal phosphate cyclase (ATP)